METKPSLEEFVKMTAFLNANQKDFPKMFAEFHVDQAKWDGIAAYWLGQFASDTELPMKFKTLIEAEMARLQK